MYTIKQLGLALAAGIAIGTFIAGVGFLLKGEYFAQTRTSAIASTFANLPLCKQEAAFNEEQGLKDVITYNTATIPRLQAIESILEDQETKTIFTKELTREKEELEVYLAVYAKTYAKDFIPTKDDIEKISNGYSFVSNNDPDAANTYLGIIQGALIVRHRDYYSRALVSSTNKDIVKNAENFIVFKDTLLKDIQKAKE
jgi:hypothetical protein